MNSWAHPGLGVLLRACVLSVVSLRCADVLVQVVFFPGVCADVWSFCRFCGVVRMFGPAGAFGLLPEQG